MGYNSSFSVRQERSFAASSIVAPNRLSSAEAGMRSRSLNSAGRLRASSKCPKEATSHWRTLPFKCKSRLPMLLLASLGRHQICSSVNDSTQLFSRGQYCSSSLWREKLRNNELRFESKVWFIVGQVHDAKFIHSRISASLKVWSELFAR